MRSLSKKKPSKLVKKQESPINTQLAKDYDIAYDFGVKAYKKFRDVVKAIILFGSVPKKEINPNSDIDVIIIIDDATINWDEELIAWYREETARLLATQKYAKKIHLNTVTLSTFWEEVREGEPLIINVIRYGQPLIDVGGFFEPLKVLLAKGRIRPSPEAIFTTMERASAHHLRGRNTLLQSVECFYWAMVDASHAALMARKVVPPSPEHLQELLTEVFVKRGLLKDKYVDWYEEVRKLAKEIAYGNINKVSGNKLEELEERTNQFVSVLHELTKALIKDEHIIKVDYKHF